MDIKDYIETIHQSRLFHGMSEQQTLRLMQYMGASIVTKQTGEYFLMQGERNADVAVIVAGQAVGERITADGNTATINLFEQGDVFGDVLSGAAITSIVGVRATTDCTVIRFAFDNMLSPCADNKEQQTMLLRNLINEISNKYFALNQRLHLVLQKSLRSKIAMYLLLYANRATSDYFTVPHNREEMAQYLNCERSALCREISRLCNEKFIATNRKNFRILNRQGITEIAG